MKIIIYNDLIEMVNSSKGILKLNDSAIIGVKASLTVLSVGSLSALASNNEQNIKYVVTLSVLSIPAVLFSGILYKMINSKEIKELMTNKLIELVPFLRESGIDTNLEFLKKATAIETRYKLSMESFPPKIIQTKLIAVPSYTIFPDTKESFIEQQHELGSEEYILSLGHASKKRKLVPAYNQV